MFFVTNQKNVKTFKVLTLSNEPVIQYIPIEPDLREKMYKHYADSGVILPDYNEFNIYDVEKIDMMVVEEDFTLEVIYLDFHYKFEIKRGFCFDGASVPTFVQFGRLSKISQYCLLASIIHDLLYGMGYVTKIMCDDFFEGLLRFKDTKEITIFIYVAGLKIGGTKKYIEQRKRYSNGKESWVANFHTIHRSLYRP